MRSAVLAVVVTAAFFGSLLVVHRMDAPVDVNPATALAAARGASVSDFMVAVNSRAGILKQMKNLMAEPEGDKTWKLVKAQASIIATLTDAVLAKHKPEKGSLSSWKEKVSGFAAGARTLATAAGKKNAEGAKAALKSLSRSCGKCHKAHK